MTIGPILADRRGWPFFDLDDVTGRHFGLSTERLQARFRTGYGYRKDCGAPGNIWSGSPSATSARGASRAPHRGGPDRLPDGDHGGHLLVQAVL